MEAWNSFLQTVFQFVKSLFTNVSKRMHRNAAVLTTGVAVVTVVAFTAGNFQGGGKNALVAFAETPGETDMGETDPEEIQAATEPETEQISAEHFCRKRQNLNQKHQKQPKQKTIRLRKQKRTCLQNLNIRKRKTEQKPLRMRQRPARGRPEAKTPGKVLRGLSRWRFPRMPKSRNV